MRLLHTSDWHLGRLLYGRSREDEFNAFLQWLLQTIRQEAIEVLLVAGDIFDNTTPSHQAQGLYYQFLSAVVQTDCRHVVIIGGNHDSASFLNAPQGLLQALDVHVVGQAPPPEEAVLPLYDAQGTLELIVCAVPYLRERDVRQVQPGESIEVKARHYVQGVQQYYQAVAAQAQRLQQEAPTVPVIAMGHLFTAGGQVLADDGVRDLIVGGLGHIPVQLFDELYDYVALGHLHVPQKVGAREVVRYSGSPLPMGFGEASQQKSVCCIELTTAGAPPQISLIPIPVFQILQRLEGDWAAIQAELMRLVQCSESIWVEIDYTDAQVIGDLRTRIDALVDGSLVEVLRVRNQALVQQMLAPVQQTRALDELSPLEVFEHCLATHEVPETQWDELKHTYQEALAMVMAEQATDAELVQVTATVKGADAAQVTSASKATDAVQPKGAPQSTPRASSDAQPIGKDNENS